MWRRVGAYVLCLDEINRILLTRFCAPGHPDHGMWTMPGGGMEWGESAERTAGRELLEETGLSAELGPVLGVYSYWYPAQEAVRGEPGHHLGIVYRAMELQGQLRAPFDGGTTDLAAWFTLPAARELALVPLARFVLDLIE